LHFVCFGMHATLTLLARLVYRLLNEIHSVYLELIAKTELA
jgi:hypothetical protein